MAIDTRNKRSSAIFVGSPWRMQYPFADGTIGQEDRQHVAFLYAGILASTPVSIPTFDVCITGSVDTTLSLIGSVEVYALAAGVDTIFELAGDGGVC